MIIGEVDGHIKEKNGSKYLVFDSTNENREALEKYTKLWDWIKNEIETINGRKEGEYGKDFIKTNFNRYDCLPLKKPLKLRMLTITVRSVFEEAGTFYLQVYSDGLL